MKNRLLKLDRIGVSDFEKKETCTQNVYVSVVFLMILFDILHKYT